MPPSKYRRILKSSSPCDLLGNALESLDHFGEPISLTYQGDAFSRSAFGGFMSLVGQVLVVIYFGFQLSDVVNRNQTQINFSTVKVDLSDFNQAPPLDLSTENFNFAVNLQYVG